MTEFTFEYDEAKRIATIMLATGAELRISNINAAQAKRWKEEKAAEFAKRNFRMETIPALMHRGEADV
jgi:hypothetical protein